VIRPYIAKDRTACIQIFKSNNPQYFDDSELADFELWLDAQDQRRVACTQKKVVWDISAISFDYYLR